MDPGGTYKRAQVSRDNKHQLSTQNERHICYTLCHAFSSQIPKFHQGYFLQTGGFVMHTIELFLNKYSMYN